MRFAQRDFEIETVLNQPLMAHLSTVHEGEPRDSPVWFIWEESSLWLFGTEKDSFVKRLKKEPRCAIGVVEFDLEKGVLKHVGVRGKAELTEVDQGRLNRFGSKYLGADQKEWNPWFIDKIVTPLTVMVKITPQSVVAKDVSFFKVRK